MPKSLANGLRALVSAGLIGALIWMTRGRFQQIGALLASVRWEWLAIGLVVYLGVAWVLSARLQQVLAVANVYLPLGLMVRLNFIGMFFNNFLPTSTGGDLVKAYYIGKRTDVAWIAWLGVVGDRLLGSVTFLLLMLPALLLRPEDPLLGTVGWSYLLVGVAALSLVTGAVAWARRHSLRAGGPGWWQRLRPLLEIFGRGPHLVRHLGCAALLSLAAQALFVTTLFLLTRSLSLSVSFAELFLIVPLVATASMLPSINGLGVRESALVLCLERSVGREPALAVAVLLLGVLFGTSLIGGLLYAVQGDMKAQTERAKRS